MRFSMAPAPHLSPQDSVDRIMLRVMLALIPGVIALVWRFGFGVIVQICIALITAGLAEATALRLRGRSIAYGLSDYSAAVTAALLAISLPPLAPWWIATFGTAFAIVIGKQLYGGLGYNPFNPAMAGYAALLISFPRQMTAWSPPLELAHANLSMGDAASLIFHRADPAGMDGWTQATPLDTWKTQVALQKHLDEIESSRLFGVIGGKGWEWANLGFLAGGLWMARARLIDWRIPAGFLSALFLCAMSFYLRDPSYYPNPLFHLFNGATMLGAFFIATDPVSAATTPRGRWIYGILIGILVTAIRDWGGYPDGVAFAVLLMNLAAPTIDHYTRPRVYGFPK
jgi:electron transport complex protein RnfD